jgi:hypothetical protein
LTVPSKDQLKQWLVAPAPMTDLREQIRQSPATPALLDAMSQEIAGVGEIPVLTYSLYRTFERTGTRGP